MKRETLIKGNEIESKITFIDDQIKELSINYTDAFPQYRIEANIVNNNSCGSTGNNHALLSSEQKQELHEIVKKMLIKNSNDLEKELKELP